MNWNATGVRSPGSSGSRLATISIGGVGFHWPLPSTTPTGTGTVRPSEVLT